MEHRPIPLPHRGPRLSARLWRPLAGALLGLGIALSAAAYLGVQRDTVLRDAEREVRNLSLVLASSLEGMFRSVDLMEVGILEWMRGEGMDRPEGFAARASSRAMYDALHARMTALPQVGSVFVTDAEGRLMVGTKAGWPTPPVNHAGRDFVRAFENPGRETFLSAPSRNSLDGVWNIYVVRRISAPDGRFVGLVGATITLDFFERFFASLALGPDSATSLLRRDGVLLARHPRDDLAVGSPVGAGAAFQRILPLARDGVVVEPSPLDGRIRIKGVRALEGYPLVALATRAVDDVLAPWRNEARRVGLLVLAIEALLGAALWLMARQARHRDAMREMRAAQADTEARLAVAEERERSAREVAARELALRAIFDTGAAGITEVDIAAGRFLRVNRRYCEITGRTEAELLGGLGPLDLVHPEDCALVQQGWAAAMAAGDNWQGELRYLRPDATAVWARLSIGISAHDAAGRPTRSVGIVQDTSASREAEALLRMSLAVGGIGSFRHDFTTGSVALGPETRAMYGLPAGEGPVPVEDWLAAVLPEDRDGLRAMIARCVETGATEGGTEYRVRRASDGALRHIESRARVEYDAAGRALAAVGVVIDVTERREADARIAHLAHHDALTDLPNRALFRERLDGALARARRGEGFAVLCLDLDRFKEVNDTLGHPAGDALLQAVAARLRAEIRETDTLARLGGDEFAVIQASLDQPRDAIALARRLVETICRPFDLDGQRVAVGTSIGIAVAPTDGLEADALLKGADMALYRAKGEGRGRWRFFEPEMDARMQLRRRLELDLRRAVEAGEFELHYQPIVAVATRRVTGLEALIRWRHPERGLVPPDSFIPLAEEIGLIVPIGAWVLQRACADATAWPGRPKVAVNLSAAQFAAPGLEETVAAALSASGLPPDRLEIEITETVMLQETEATLATLHRLKALGAGIALDDFGTGYSSLAYLQKFPFDKVKIDRAFTAGLEHSPQSNAIVRAVAELGAGLGMTTTAEGVETAEQLALLGRTGCTEAQGYLFSPPVPAAQVPGLLRRLRQPAAALPAEG